MTENKEELNMKRVLVAPAARRLLYAFTFISLLMLFAFSAIDVLQTQLSEAQVMTKELQASMTADQILQKFKDGNRRFVEGKMLHRDYMMEKDLTAAAQHPYGVVLSCIDSRKPAEIIFDKGIGDI